MASPFDDGGATKPIDIPPAGEAPRRTPSQTSAPWIVLAVVATLLVVLFVALAALILA